MKEEKARQILEAMQGITYLEWRKLSHTIETAFSSEAGRQSNSIEIASPDEILKKLQVLF